MKLILFSVFVFFFYFLPSVVGAARKHHQSNAIFVLNLLLGWTFVGWAVALAWAFTAVQQPMRQH